MRINNKPGINITAHKKKISLKQNGEEKPEVGINAKDLLDSNALNSLLANNIKAGEKMTISSGEDDLLTIRKERGPSRLRELGRSLAIEAGGIVKYDKGLAFKLGAMAVKETDLIGVAATVTKSVDQAYLPMLRIVGGLLDAHTMVRTIKNPNSTWIDKTIDIGHLATDVAGIAGSVMSFTGIAPTISNVLTVTGIMGDVGAHGYHIIRYFEEKGDTLTLGGNTSQYTQNTGDNTGQTQGKDDDNTQQIEVPNPTL